MVIQRKTQRPVQFELTEPTRAAVSAWLEKSHLRGDQFLFPSRVAKSPHVSTRQYARIVHHWAESAGLDMERTVCTPPYESLHDLRAENCRFGASVIVSALAQAAGAINPDVIQANIQQTICVPGYTKTVRPVRRKRTGSSASSCANRESTTPIWPNTNLITSSRWPLAAIPGS